MDGNQAALNASKGGLVNKIADGAANIWEALARKQVDAHKLGWRTHVTAYAVALALTTLAYNNVSMYREASERVENLGSLGAQTYYENLSHNIGSVGLPDWKVAIGKGYMIATWPAREYAFHEANQE